MKKFLIIRFLFLLCFLNSKISSSQTLNWADINSTAGYFQGGIALDDTGNVYKIGTYAGPTDFDPGLGTYIVSTSGIYIQKLSPSGALLWVKTIESTSLCRGNAIAVSKNGNIYCTGSYRGTVDFDPGVGVSSISNFSSDDDFFVMKLDSTGEFAWAYGLGGFSSDVGNAIAIDSSENVIVTGDYRSTVDFDPTSGVESHSSGSGTSDIFITKYSKDGTYLWTKTFLGIAGHDYGLGVAPGRNSEIFVTGQFSGTIDFDPGVGVSSLVKSVGYACFVLCLDSSGDFSWAKDLGAGIWNAVGKGIVVDTFGNSYITGYFDGTGDFDPGAGVYSLTASAGQDPFICKLLSGGIFDWAGSISAISSGSSLDNGLAVALDKLGNVYFTGYFRGTADLDPTSGSYSVVSALSSDDIFLTKLDNSGAFLSALHFSSGGSQLANSIKLDSANNFYLSGYMSGTVDFDPSVGIWDLSGSSSDFTAKYSQPFALPTLLNQIEIACFENFPRVSIEFQNHANLSSAIIQSSLYGLEWIPVSSNIALVEGIQKIDFVDRTQLNQMSKYYRMKFENFDADYFYSSVAKSNCESFSDDMKLFPNPANTSLQLILCSADQFIQLEIRNMLGELVYSKEKCSVETCLDISNLKSGIYLVKVHCKENDYSSKLFINK